MRLSASCLLARSPILGPLPWRPACNLQLAHPAIDLGCLRGVSTPGQPEVIQYLEGLEASRGLFLLLFLGSRVHSHPTCGPLIPRAVLKDPKGGVDVEGGHGCHCVFLLEIGW